MTPWELIGLITGAFVLVGMIYGAIKVVVVPIISIQKDVLIIKVMLEGSEKTMQQNRECLDETKVVLEEHESRLNVIDSLISVYHAEKR